MSASKEHIPSELRTKLEATLDYVIPSMVRFLWERPRNRPAALGSGVVVKLDDGLPRVVTAGHVFDGDGKGPGGGLRMGAQSPLIPLIGKPSRSRLLDAEGIDRLDLASFSLDQKTVQTLGAFRAIPTEELADPAPYDPARRYAVAGFPVSKGSKPVPAGEPLRAGLMLFVGRERAPSAKRSRAWIEPDIHLTINWDHKVGVHSEGGLQMPPGLAGVSGGVVLDLGTTLDPSAQPKAVGIFTHHLRDENAMVATRFFPTLHIHRRGSVD